MERDELLKRLHNIDLQISLTVMPSEMVALFNAGSTIGSYYKPR